MDDDTFQEYRKKTGFTGDKLKSRMTHTANHCHMNAIPLSAKS